MYLCLHTRSTADRYVSFVAAAFPPVSLPTYSSSCLCSRISVGPRTRVPNYLAVNLITRISSFLHMRISAVLPICLPDRLPAFLPLHWPAYATVSLFDGPTTRLSYVLTCLLHPAREECRYRATLTPSAGPRSYYGVYNRI